MALELSLYGRIPVEVMQEAVRMVLPQAVEQPGARAVVSSFSHPRLWISVGRGAEIEETPAGPVECETFTDFRLDKTDPEPALLLALACVRALLDASSEDCVLRYLWDTVTLVRVAGAVHLYEYRDEGRFWNPEKLAALGGGRSVEEIVRPIEDDDDLEEE